LGLLRKDGRWRKEGACVDLMERSESGDGMIVWRKGKRWFWL
jgi:hypothetical protein